MFSNISFNDYRCQLESRLPSEANWERNEKMAYCEGFSALIAEKSCIFAGLNKKFLQKVHQKISTVRDRNTC